LKRTHSRTKIKHPIQTTTFKLPRSNNSCKRQNLKNQFAQSHPNNCIQIDPFKEPHSSNSIKLTTFKQLHLNDYFGIDYLEQCLLNNSIQTNTSRQCYSEDSCPTTRINQLFQATHSSNTIQETPPKQPHPDNPI